MQKRIKILVTSAVLLSAIIALAVGISCQESVQTEMPQVSDERKPPLTLLYFYKDTCPSCTKMKPIVDGLEKEYVGFVRVERWDVSKPVCHIIADQYHVHGVPTLVLIDSAGQVLGRWVGYEPADKIEQLLDWLQSTYKQEE